MQLTGKNKKAFSVKTERGSISGMLEGHIFSFLGIPYAIPPVGNLRWEKPFPVSSRKEILNCYHYKPSCPQPEILFSGIEKTSEDCLYLNIWTPEPVKNAGLPVIVWIHGGGFSNGSGSMAVYRGNRIASRGVVFVSINYRLGAFGFLAHPSLQNESKSEPPSPNYGLLDQVEALRWIKENIHCFGGDSELITVCGESAGAVSVSCLLSSPLAKGLMNRAVVQSGPLWIAEGLPGSSWRMESALINGEWFANRLGVNESSKNAASILRGISASKIVNASVLSKHSFPRNVQFGPVVDEYLLYDMPHIAFQKKLMSDVPLMVGSNEREADLFFGNTDMSYEDLRKLTVEAYGKNSDELLSAIGPSSEKSATQLASDLLTSMEFSTPARFAAESFGISYLYGFSMFPKGSAVSACHGIEVPYILRNTHLFPRFSRADLRVSESASSYWINFAKEGDPNGKGLEKWLPFLKERPLYLNIGKEIKTKSCEERMYEIAKRVHL